VSQILVLSKLSPIMLCCGFPCLHFKLSDRIDMNCPHCNSKKTTQLKSTTLLGYQKYRCADCTKQFNERTGTPYNFLEYPTDVVNLTVFYYYHFKNNLVDVTKHMALRGIMLSHETVRLCSQARFSRMTGLLQSFS